MFKVRSRSKVRSRVFAAVTAVVAAAGAGVWPATTAAAAAPAVVRDGASSDTAAASCWAIKQDVPASTDGVYWLQTPTLVAPQQFYCDMTTDGGGWVLVGRGREGWTWSYLGQGTAGAVRNTPSGTAAFAPAALSAQTIDGLLDGGRVDALADGVRVRRATDIAGATAQEMRLKYQGRPSWSWAVGGGDLLSGVVIDGTTYGGGNTSAWGVDNNFRRFTTSESKTHNYRKGWAYGTGIAGQNNASSYLWQYTTEKSALPFSQVFIRPKLTSTSLDYPSIPSGGLPASTLRKLMSSTTSDTTPWGVTGVVGGKTGEFEVEVEAFATIGRTMYVGGKFQYVQKGPNPGPGEKVQQSYLAAFDVDNGEWRPDFRPVLNGMVWDLQAVDGKLVVGGEFTNVNGVANTTALAALDPATGAVLPGWRADTTYPSTSGLPAQVKALDYQDGWLYVGGRFTRVAGGSPLGAQVTVGRAARVRGTDGKPDGTWKPNFDGTVIDLDASDRGDRVYMSGYFNNLNGTASPQVGVVTTAPGAARVPNLGQWQPSIGSVKHYQQVIREVGDSVWQGGSEHDLQRYDRATYSPQNFNITRAGGDFQALAVVDGVVYASCHCGNFSYSGTNNYSNPIPSATQVDSIKYIGAWDATTGQFISDFYPGALDTRSGLGPWELTADPNGCLWFGGDMTRGSYQGTGYQWLGGFGKFCPRDSTAPTTPTDLTATSATGSDVKLTWGQSTDSGSTPRYEVLRDDRVVATVSGTTYTDTPPAFPAKYWVRAIDSDGNRSATTSVTTVMPPPATILAYGSTWKYSFDGSDPGATWTAGGYDDSTWASGAAELGYNDGDEATTIWDATQKSPVTAYFRTTVQVSDPAAYQSLLLDLVRDDGAVVYVNGTEVARTNMPAVAVTGSTLASSGISSRADETTPVSFTVPASALVAGTNTIAVEVHQYNPAVGGDLSFKLQARLG